MQKRTGRNDRFRIVFALFFWLKILLNTVLKSLTFFFLKTIQTCKNSILAQNYKIHLEALRSAMARSGLTETKAV